MRAVFGNRILDGGTWVSWGPTLLSIFDYVALWLSSSGSLHDLMPINIVDVEI